MKRSSKQEADSQRAAGWCEAVDALLKLASEQRG